MAYFLGRPMVRCSSTGASGYWSGIVANLRPDATILAVTGRPNIDGEPHQGSLAQFLVQQVELLRPSKVVLCHHDALLPPITQPVDTGEALAHLAQILELHPRHVELSYANAVEILPRPVATASTARATSTTTCAARIAAAVTSTRPNARQSDAHTEMSPAGRRAATAGASAARPPTSTTRWTTSSTSAATTSTGCARTRTCCSSAGRASGRTRPALWTARARSPRCWRRKGIRHELDLWGYDVAHDWPSWRAQLAHHLPRFC